jgi:uncharacterized RDD family membrane protein YckC
MAVGLQPANGLKRVLAVFVDWFVLTVVSIAVGILPNSSLYYGVALFLLIDVGLTAFFGLSAGRFVTRIRVVRVSDGGPPGLWAAVLRTGLVAITGWIGLFYYSLSLRFRDAAPPRMWWDSAAGTQLVLAAAPRSLS